MCREIPLLRISGNGIVPKGNRDVPGREPQVCRRNMLPTDGQEDRSQVMPGLSVVGERTQGPGRTKRGITGKVFGAVPAHRGRLPAGSYL